MLRTKAKIQSWNVVMTNIARAIPFAQIRLILMLLLILLSFAALLISPILLSLLMPTGS
jgi:hypothetical protein